MFDWYVDLWRPPLPVSLSLLLGLLAVVAALWPVARLAFGLGSRQTASTHLTAPRWLALTGLRLIALAGVLLLLAGPSVVEPVTQHETQPVIVILADSSASMNEADASLPTASARPPNGGADEASATLKVTRWEAIARTWLDPLLQLRLSQRAQLQTLSFDKETRPLPQGTALSLLPQGHETRIFAALSQATGLAAQAPETPAQASSPSEGKPQASTSPSGLIVLLSDGRDTQRGFDEALLAKIAAAGWRIWCVPVGQATASPDLSLTAWAEADRLFPGETTTIHATVSQRGLDDARVTVQLFQDDQLIASQPLALQGQPSATTRFTISPDARDQAPGLAGLHDYRVQVVPLAAERQTANNARHVFVQVVRERIGILLLEGQPYWDTRFLSRVLGRDAQVALTSVMALGDGRFIVTRPELPAPGVATFAPADGEVASTELAELLDNLNAFDVVILGRGIERFFPGDGAEKLVAFVQDHGGALVLARGPAFDDATPQGAKAAAILQPVLPVTWGRESLYAMELRLTPMDLRHPLMRNAGLAGDQAADTLARLPHMLAARQVLRAKPGVAILLSQKAIAPLDGNRPTFGADQLMPALALGNAGRGRVLAVLFDGMWQWAFLPDAQRRFDSIYHAFWTAAVRDLALGGETLPGGEVSMALDRLAAQPGEAVTVTITTRDVMPATFAPRLRLTLPDGTRQTLLPQRAGQQATTFTASFEPTLEGVYQVDLLLPEQDTPDAKPQAGTGTQEEPGEQGVSQPRQTLKLAVADRNVELRDTSANPALLAAIAQATGGRVLGLQQADALLAEAAQVVATRREGQRHRYAIGQPPLIVAIFIGFFGYWFLRRQWGLA